MDQFYVRVWQVAANNGTLSGMISKMNGLSQDFRSQDRGVTHC